MIMAFHQVYVYTKTDHLCGGLGCLLLCFLTTQHFLNTFLLLGKFPIFWPLLLKVEAESPTPLCTLGTKIWPSIPPSSNALLSWHAQFWRYDLWPVACGKATRILLQ
jgi:hypothetical protein